MATKNYLNPTDPASNHNCNSSIYPATRHERPAINSSAEAPSNRSLLDPSTHLRLSPEAQEGRKPAFFVRSPEFGNPSVISCRDMCAHIACDGRGCVSYKGARISSKCYPACLISNFHAMSSLVRANSWRQIDHEAEGRDSSSPSTSAAHALCTGQREWEYFGRGRPVDFSWLFCFVSVFPALLSLVYRWHGLGWLVMSVLLLCACRMGLFTIDWFLRLRRGSDYFGGWLIRSSLLWIGVDAFSSWRVIAVLDVIVILRKKGGG